MKTREALIQYFAAQGIGNDGEWYQDGWYRIAIAGRKVPVYPMWGLKNSLILHDVHHLVTGYDTSWGGELSLAGWELGSGGCAWHAFFWVDRLFFGLLGLLFVPRRMWHAFRAGLHARNLYRRGVEGVLAAEIEDLRHYVETV